MTLEERARQWVREPLVHFLLGGLLIFALFAWRGEETDPASRLIDVDRETQAQIALQFERTVQRPPTDSELDGLIEQWVREEVLYREALRLGLDAGDPVVRRRLAKKMDFLAASSAEAVEPSDSELEEWFAANAARYADKSTASFDQVWFAQAPDTDAVTAQLQSAGEDWRSVGEPVSLPAVVEERQLQAVGAQFGTAFADELAAMEVGNAWSGPVRSGLGWHMVRLRARKSESIPALADIRQRVTNDWRLATAQSREDQAYALLRDAYTVEIDR
ncbi:peptidyl-prolyl cis-trans isomerase [Parerythrobacter jejuensis]|uniref:peptidylprolyl isomerase n=1 Tax=Parerythrobacter jejuensis TaxID=795812 RepID=A0A845AIN0_9SPHN|nr:peptidylprolyl isomerase [Parerythrobacter jejuensis]MXP30542.1 peptidyl-prolyl cis-trans isomerase [Parerythrobacter jejuensis]MXP33302.1 peptidyl-prolyl cis-trans isomerase [Parerythrobacter jejuensis]